MAFPARGKTAPKNEVRRQPPYNVILLNDDDHTYRYVIEMLQKSSVSHQKKDSK